MGIIIGSLGVCGAALDLAGRYDELGALFFVFVIIQLPVYLISFLLIKATGLFSIYFLLTFCWWFILGFGACLAPAFLINYFGLPKN